MTLARSLLFPFSVLYEAAARLRAGLYDVGIFSRKKLPGTIISVGNLTVGGTGKTPMVIWLAHNLIQNGANVGILTRGYTGFMQSGRASSEQTHAPQENLPDEPTLIASRLSRFSQESKPPGKFHVAAQKDRAADAQKFSASGFDTFILDDAFQSLYLHRDLDIVLIDALSPFGGGLLLPAGRLREPKSALRRAGIIVITRSQHAPAIEGVVRRYTAAPIFYATITLDSLASTRRVDHLLTPSAPLPDDLRHSTKFFAFSAIGNPSAFLENLREWGVPVAGSQTFRDHHRFTVSDLQNIERQATAAGASALICTEKDLINLGPHDFQKLPLYTAVISLQLHDAAKFWQAADQILHHRATAKKTRT
jgi:tetraacyldisaccharide 4'-kinase